MSCPLTICRKKRSFSSKHAAKKSAQRARKVRADLRLRPYECAVCGGWHLTSLPLARLQREAKRRRLEARAVAGESCDQCGAEPGRSCRDQLGAPLTGFHPARWKSARGAS